MTARLTQLYAEAFNALGVHVLEMHSRKSQPQRTKCAEQFREGDNLILFTSDVSARGMDYPDVTAVVQVGMPSDKAQYIHRLGRTARAGKAGGGFLLLNDFESFFLSHLSDLPISQRPPLAPAAAAPPAAARRRLRPPPTSPSAAAAGVARLCNSHLRKLRWSQEELVRRANDFSAQCLGLRAAAARGEDGGQDGAQGVPGLNIYGRNGIAPKEGGGGGRQAAACAAAAAAVAAAVVARRRRRPLVSAWVVRFQRVEGGEGSGAACDVPELTWRVRHTLPIDFVKCELPYPYRT